MEPAFVDSVFTHRQLWDNLILMTDDQNLEAVETQAASQWGQV